MKKIYLLVFLAALFSTTAQTLTQAFNEPVAGDVDKSYRLDTSAYTNGLPIKVTGNTLNWDFTLLTGAFPVVVDSFIAPSAAPQASAYPGTSYAQHRDGLYTFYKSTSSPQQTELLGGVYSSSLSLTFTNSAVIASYPVSYGYNLSDPVGGTFKYGTQNGTCIGNITISANGLGTANFPGNVALQNVLCLRSVEILTLSIGFFPFATFNQSIYNYYMPGKKFPILNVSYTTYQIIGGGTPTVTAFINGSNDYFSVVGINEMVLNKEDYKVFPNPFHDHLSVISKNAMEENTYTVYDNKGQLIIRTKSIGDENIRELSPGMYVLEIKNKTGVLHQKIIKD